MQSVSKERKIPRILLVEDEALNALFIEHQLKKLGYIIDDHTSTGEDAIKSAIEHKPDLIIMDIRLAGDLDGIETARQIQKELKSPIIFVTGYDDNSVRESAMALEPVGYLLKPLNINQLNQLLNKLFKQ